MTWDELIEKIRFYKTKCEAKQFRLNRATMQTLLFAGAFDSLIASAYGEPCAVIYQKLSSELDKVLGYSGVNTEFAEISSDVLLKVWRTQHIPILHEDLLTSKIIKTMKEREYSYTPHSGRVFYKDNVNVYRNWSDIARYWDAVSKGDAVVTSSGRYFQQHLAGVLGIVLDFEIKISSKTGKEYGVLTVLVGSETSDKIFVWPMEKSGKISEIYRSALASGRFGVVIMSIKARNGEKLHVLERFEEIKG